MSIIYFGLISGYALFWRWWLCRSLMRSRGGWKTIAESTDAPNTFDQTV